MPNGTRYPNLDCAFRLCIRSVFSDGLEVELQSFPVLATGASCSPGGGRAQARQPFHRQGCLVQTGQVGEVIGHSVIASAQFGCGARGTSCLRGLFASVIGNSLCAPYVCLRAWAIPPDTSQPLA